MSSAIESQLRHSNNLGVTRYIVLAFFFAFLSSLRLPFLPEFQAIVIVGLIFLGRAKTFNFLALLVIFFCSHHYVIPDVIMRMDPAQYPSIYTAAHGPLKVFDIIVIALLVASVPYLPRLRYVYLSKRFPGVLLWIGLLGACFYPSSHQNVNNGLFLARSILFTLSIYLLVSQLESKQVSQLAYIAIIAWTAKMFFSIIFVADHPMYRQVFGMDGIIYFAGDEYLSLGVYVASIIVLSRLAGDTRSVKWALLFLLMSTALFLSLLAQRKGAPSYFLIVFLMMAIERYNIKSMKLPLNLLILLSPWATFLFLLIILPQADVLIRAAFFEYSNLLDSALSSLYHLAQTRPHNAFLGIGPAGMYEIINLHSINDHQTSFGKEVGERYRYAIWSIPYTRLILNVGALGFVLAVVYLISAIRMPVASFYLYSAALIFFYIGNITPPAAVSLGIAFVVLTNFFKRKAQNASSRRA